MTPRHVLTLLAAGGLLLAACDDGFAPRAEPIQAFVAGAELPRPQPATEVVRIASPDMAVFRVSWGRPLDCTAGCFYSFGIGLRIEDRVGWLRVEDFGGGVAASGLRRFDFAGADAGLFQDDVLRRLRAADDWTYQYAVLPALAADEDTPEAMLLRLSRELLLTVNLELARALISNPGVHASAPVLERLAALPDAYARVREEAARLLGERRARS